MALDEAKATAALDYIVILDKKLDEQVDRFRIASEEMGRRLEMHGEAIRLSNEKAISKTIKEEVAALEERITERVGLLIQAQTAGQCSDIETMKDNLGELKIQVDGIDTRTRDFPLMRGKLEQIEARPGQMAIRAWQWLAVGGVSLLGVIFSAIALFKGSV